MEQTGLWGEAEGGPAGNETAAVPNPYCRRGRICDQEPPDAIASLDRAQRQRGAPAARLTDSPAANPPLTGVDPGF